MLSAFVPPRRGPFYGRPRPWFCVLVVAAALGFCSFGNQTLHAREKTLTVLDLDFQGRIRSVAKSQFYQSMVEGLAAAGFQVYAQDIQQIEALGVEASKCVTPDCLKKAGTQLGVGFLLRGTVSVRLKNYKIVLQLSDARDGRLLGETQQTCEICGSREASKTLRNAAETLNAFVPKESTGVLTIRTNPNGAVARLNGRALGRTPVTDLKIKPGKYEISVAQGGREKSVSIDVDADYKQILNLDLPRAQMRDRSNLRTWGWVTTGVGVLALGIGGVMTALNASDLDCNGDCEGLSSPSSFKASSRVLGAD